MDPAKRAALDGVLNQIERSYGRGSIVKLGDAGNMVVDSISTGACCSGSSRRGCSLFFSSYYLLSRWNNERIEEWR